MRASLIACVHLESFQQPPCRKGRTRYEGNRLCWRRCVSSWDIATCRSARLHVPQGGHLYQYRCDIAQSHVSPLTARFKNAVNIPNIRKQTLTLTTPSVVSLHSSLSTVNRLQDGRARNRDSILDRTKRISHLRNVQAGSEAPQPPIQCVKVKVTPWHSYGDAEGKRGYSSNPFAPRH
jgi:hypothetical protein